MQINKLNLFLSDYPLYKPFKAIENYKAEDNATYNQPHAFHGKTFDYYCEHEASDKTFEIKLPGGVDNWRTTDGPNIPKDLFNDKDELNFVHHFEAYCKSCKEYKIELVFHVWSDDIIPDNKYHHISGPPGLPTPVNKFANVNANIFIEKIGLFPQQMIVIDSEIKKHFDRETNNWYFKALKSIQQNYGIGAFAYFRRIIEKELLKIVKEISELNATDPGLKKLLDEYQNTNQVYSIYENIFELLPKSLQSLGNNPIKILYNQTSEGLHSLSEDECLSRSSSINLLLIFVMKKINEEKSEILKVREALRALK